MYSDCTPDYLKMTALNIPAALVVSIPASTGQSFAQRLADKVWDAANERNCALSSLCCIDLIVVCQELSQKRSQWESCSRRKVSHASISRKARWQLSTFLKLQ